MLASPTSVTAQTKSASGSSGTSTTTVIDYSKGTVEAPPPPVQRSRSEVTADLNVDRATAAQIQAKLDELNGTLTTQHAELDRLSAEATVAEQKVIDADTAVAAATEQEQATVQRVRALAVDVFVNPPSELYATALLSSTATDLSARQSILKARAEEQANVLDRHRAAVAELKSARDTAVSARDALRAKAAEQQQLVTETEATRDAQQAVVSDLDVRIDRSLAELSAINLADAQRAADMRRQQQELLALSRAATTTQPPPIRPVTTRPVTVTQPRATPIATEATAAPTTGAPTPTPTAPPTTRPPIVGSGDIVTVAGIQVNRSIAGAVQRLIEDATAAGLVLSGGGYRNSDAQIATRKANCGTDDYSIWFKPASQCTPPTARPGTSMHEQGLAIDFTCSGALISARSGPCWNWLATNAASYGLYNLPAEPWHWSVNGN
jgi:hypothetical protein